LKLYFVVVDDFHCVQTTNPDPVTTENKQIILFVLQASFQKASL